MLKIKSSEQRKNDLKFSFNKQHSGVFSITQFI